jgi:hypothetical protein
VLHALSCHSFSLVHSNHIWWILYVIKLLVMQFTPSSYYFIPLRSKYSPQYHFLKHFLFILFPYLQRSSFTPIRNYRIYYSIVYLIFIFLYSRLKGRSSKMNSSKLLPKSRIHLIFSWTKFWRYMNITVNLLTMITGYRLVSHCLGAWTCTNTLFATVLPLTCATCQGRACSIAEAFTEALIHVICGVQIYSPSLLR